MTKAAVKRLVRDENGRAILLALLLLGVGGLIMAPLLSYMSTGLISGGVYERRMDEVYAADAGAEDAVWKIQHPDEAGYLPCNPSSPAKNYTITDVNGKTVEVYIYYCIYEDGVAYRVESTATGDGSGTEIEAYITGESSYGDYGDLLNHIVTCQGEIEQAKKVYLTYPPGSEPVESYTGAWPTPQEFEDFYWEDVKDETPYGSSTIDLNGNNMNLGPLYRNGTLTIKNSSDTPATLTLTGTLYITGDTQICYGTSGNKPMTLDLNGQTIFVASSSTGSGQEALKIGDKCNIKGYGAIIAVGDIYFKPQSQVTTDPVFVLSVSGKTWLQPNGNIYGAVAGSVEVDLQPGTSLTYPTGGFGDFDLNFLQQMAYSIVSWEVIPL